MEKFDYVGSYFSPEGVSLSQVFPVPLSGLYSVPRAEILVTLQEAEEEVLGWRRNSSQVVWFSVSEARVVVGDIALILPEMKF